MPSVDLEFRERAMQTGTSSWTELRMMAGFLHRPRPSSLSKCLGWGLERVKRGLWALRLEGINGSEAPRGRRSEDTRDTGPFINKASRRLGNWLGCDDGSGVIGEL